MRTQYNNGNDISLQENGCDGCSPDMINGILCHESGCPDAWRDYDRDCKWCGQTFQPENRNQQFCDNECATAYN